MIFKMEHNGICVEDLQRTISFYEKALQLKVLREKSGPDRDLIFLGNEHSAHQIEVIRFHESPCELSLGDNPCHLAFRTDDFEAAKALHTEMGCISRELPEFGIYFIKDPDGYECEIMPVRK